jgi:hypothetical protein
MAFAPTSGSRFAYVAETVFGTTPATPTFLPIRLTGAGMRTNKSTAQSDEIRADRNVVDEFQLGQDAAGSYDFEFSYGSFDDFLAACLFSSWSSDVLKNGVTPKSFTLEETLRVGGVQNSFSRFTGTMVNSISLAMTARAKITGSIALMGQKEALASAIITGATYTAPNTEPVLTASAHVMDLTVGGSAIKLRSLSLEMTNNLRTRPVVGSLYSEEFGAGRFGVTGTLEAYFDSNALYQEVLDHGGGAVSLTVGAATGKKYTIDMPKIIFLNGERRVGGVDDDVMVSIPFRAVYDETLAATISFTRAVA